MSTPNNATSKLTIDAIDEAYLVDIRRSVREYCTAFVVRMSNDDGDFKQITDQRREKAAQFILDLISCSDPGSRKQIAYVAEAAARLQWDESIKDAESANRFIGIEEPDRQGFIDNGFGRLMARVPTILLENLEKQANQPRPLESARNDARSGVNHLFDVGEGI